MFITEPSRSVRRFLLSTLYGLLATFFCLPLFAAPLALGRGDWDQHLFYYAAVIKSVVEYGQLPFWNPWYCGGNILWQNPQVALLSPVYPLTLVMPLALAMKVNIVLHYWLGLTGMHVLLTRGVGMTFLPAVVGLSVIYVASGAPALHFAVGHSVFLPAFYLPFLVFFFLRAVRERRARDVVLGAVCLALMVLNGGLHVVPMAIVAVGVLALSLAIVNRSWRPLGIAAVICATGLAFSAPKLLPAVELVASDYFYDGRLADEGPDFMTPELLRRAYTDSGQTIGLKYAAQLHGWWEYGNYIGDVVVAAFAGSLFWIFLYRGGAERPIGIAVACSALFLLILSAGAFHPYAPAALLARLPFFSRFRIPSRFTIPTLLMATLTIGWALREFRGMNGRRFLIPALATMLCAWVSWQVVRENRTLLDGVFVEPPLERPFRPLGGPESIVTDGDSNAFAPGSPMLRALMNDTNFYNCYEPVRLVRTADSHAPLVSSDGSAQIVRTVFSPNRVEADVIAGATPARIVLNENYAGGWRSAPSGVTLDADRKMSVVVPPGHRGPVTFSYVPPRLVEGLAIALAAGAASVVLWRRSSL